MLKNVMSCLVEETPLPSTDCDRCSAVEDVLLGIQQVEIIQEVSLHGKGIKKRPPKSPVRLTSQVGRVK